MVLSSGPPWQADADGAPPLSLIKTPRAWLRKNYVLFLSISALILVPVAVLIIAPIVVLVVRPGEPTPLTGPKINLNYSSYVGTRLPNDINQFLGMRYAAAPIGNLRWRAPIDPPVSNFLESASQFGPICLGSGSHYPRPNRDEDCLFVNVWAPAGATPQSKLPVWVFISGGGYSTLSNANWNGATVVERSGKSIVMVNFNYRVGLWGFLNSERIKDDGDLNVGMLDQRHLFKWVKTHIAKFGGDPDHVVIHGASAGAGAVALHLAAYGGRDEHLFAGAVSESLFFPTQPRLGDIEWQFDRVAKQLGCDGAGRDAQVGCLRAKDVGALQAANSESPFPGRPEFPVPLFYWTPCIDGDMLRDYPYKLFEAGEIVQVPVLFGTDNNEGSVFAFNAADEQEMQTFFQNNFPGLSDNDTAKIIDQYPLQEQSLPKHDAWYPSASQAYGEAVFICPTVTVLDAIAASRANETKEAPPADIFSYRYNVEDHEYVEKGLGVPHIFEAAAVFGPHSIGAFADSYQTYNAPIVPVVMDYWISFVRSLDPNPFRNDEAPEWEPWGGNGTAKETTTTTAAAAATTTASRRRLLFELDNTRMEEVPDTLKDRCDFWKTLGGTVMEQKRSERGEGRRE